MIKDVVKRLCSEKGMTISKLEKELGFSNYAIAKWDRTTPRIDSVKKVADYFGVGVDYLLAEENETHETLPASVEKRMDNDRRQNPGRRSTDNDAQLILDELSTIIKNYGIPLMPENKKIPVVGTITCGPNGIAFEDISSYIYIDESLHGDFALHTKGDSMQDKGINDGDLAIIRQQDDVESGEIAAVLIDNEEATLKRVVKIPNGIALEAANSRYETRYFMDSDMQSIKILGKLLEIRKRF